MHRGSLLALALVACGSRTPLGLDELLPDAAPVSTCNETPIGTPVMLASAPMPMTATQSPAALAIDATRVYWSSTGTILTAPLAGGQATTLAVVPADTQSIAAADGVVYAGGSSILAIPAAGGMPTTLVSGSEGVGALQVAGSQLAWLGLLDKYYGFFSLVTAPLHGGAQALVESDVSELAVDATYLYFDVHPTSGDSAIVRMPITGGSATTLASLSMPRATGLTQNAANLYWLSIDTSANPPSTTGSLVGVSKSGGTPSTIGTPGTFPLGWFVVDNCHAYVAITSGIVRVPLSGGKPVVLSTMPNAVVGGVPMAIDATSVYWLFETDSQWGVMKDHAVVSLQRRKRRPT